MAKGEPIIALVGNKTAGLVLSTLDNLEKSRITVCAIFSATIFKTAVTSSFSTKKGQIWYKCSSMNGK